MTLKGGAGGADKIGDVFHIPDHVFGPVYGFQAQHRHHHGTPGPLDQSFAQGCLKFPDRGT